VLFFEFFPLGVAMIGGAAAVVLWVINRRAQQGPNPEPHRPRIKAPHDVDAVTDGKPIRRPSMSE
jgi:hypothetical protein